MQKNPGAEGVLEDGGTPKPEPEPRPAWAPWPRPIPLFPDTLEAVLPGWKKNPRLRLMRRVIVFFIRCGDELSLAAIAAFILLGAALTQTGLLYVVDSAILAALVLGKILPRLSLQGLVLRRETPPQVFEGDRAVIRLRVSNPTRRRRSFLLLEEATPSAGGEGPGVRSFIIHDVPAGGEWTGSYETDCPLRGVFSFPGTTISTPAPFNLFPARKRLEGSQDLVVYPVGPRLRTLSLASLSTMASTHGKAFSLTGMSYDYLGVREHRPGDSTRFIHWPSTAHRQQLMMKEFKETTSQAVAVLLYAPRGSNCGTGREASLEYAVKAAVSILQYAFDRGFPVVLMAARGKGPAILRRPARLDALEFLARIRDEASPDPRETFERAAELIEPNGHFFVISTSPALDTDALLRCRDRRASVSVVLVDGPSFQEAGGSCASPEEDLFQMTSDGLAALSIPCLLIRGGDDLAARLGGTGEVHR